MTERKNQKTKIIATVGPACNTYEKIIGLVHAGVDVFRLNFSHGKHEDHASVINIITKINEQYPFNIAILADLQGPKLRIGEVENNGVELHLGDTITFTMEKCIGTKSRVYLSYPNFHSDVKVGEKILIDDGKIEVRITEIHSNFDVSAVVTTPGLLSSKKGINLPETKISLPALTQKDLIDIDFIISQNIDWVALSFVRNPDDIHQLRSILKEKAGRLLVFLARER